jgi:hypothetical protein
MTRWETALSEVNNFILHQQVIALETKVDKLAGFVRHNLNCKSLVPGKEEGYVCDCGLWDALYK